MTKKEDDDRKRKYLAEQRATRAHSLSRSIWNQITLSHMEVGATDPLMMLVAVEIVASMVRRQALELRVPRDTIKEVRGEAIEAAGNIYEVLGIGPTTRAAVARDEMFEAVTSQATKHDNDFDPMEKAKAEAAAAASIDKILKSR